ncbi:hypothetical protein P2318_25140 [Myxococcaceae bacterium GXIMD 01537]
MSEEPPVQRFTLSEDLRLVPVVEFAPWLYERSERAMPEGSGYEVPEEWLRYWKASLADLGIHDLEPLRPASFLVPLQRLTAPHVLRKLIQVAFQAASFSGEEEDAEILGALSGGHALLDAGRVVIEPRCCCDLGNLSSWWNVARRQDDGFWIGHPSVQVTHEAGGMVLREVEELHIGAPSLRAWRISPEALARAIPEAIEEQESFSRRLEPILAEGLSPALAPELARRLAGLETC